MSQQYKTSQAGIDLIKSFESLRLEAYPDPGTGAAPWTIGYGSTGGVTPAMMITEAEAENRLRADLARTEDAVSHVVTTSITQHQFDALVSFTFNEGIGNLTKSTLLARVNQRRFTDAATEFTKWDYANHKEMAGLLRRRKAEAALFQS